MKLIVPFGSASAMNQATVCFQLEKGKEDCCWWRVNALFSKQNVIKLLNNGEPQIIVLKAVNKIG